MPANPTLYYLTLPPPARPKISPLKKIPEICVLISPPTSWEQSVTNSLVGPYTEGSLLLLACESAGGKPLPELTWYRGGGGGDTTSLLGDESFYQQTVTSSSVHGGGVGQVAVAATHTVVRKELRLRVGREHLSEKLYCKVLCSTVHVQCTCICLLYCKPFPKSHFRVIFCYCY